jgi:hypothetical protein
MSIDEIRAAALELDAADRASLAHDLLVSLDAGEPEDGWEEAWGRRSHAATTSICGERRS